MDKDTHFIDNTGFQEDAVEGPPAVSPDSHYTIIPVQDLQCRTHFYML